MKKILRLFNAQQGHKALMTACSVAGCSRPTIAKTLCTKHYQRLKATGSTADPIRRRGEPLTLRRLMECVSYEPATGEFVRLSSGKPVAANRGAGGYLRLMIDGRRYKAHQLAWLYITGALPTLPIDHINGDQADNRASNLREVPQQENVQNARKPRRNNELGVLGVSRRGDKYRAQIRANGRVFALGSFDDPDSAHAAYIEAKRRLHPGNTL